MILKAAAPSKTTTCIGKFNAKLQASPWYDYECKAQRQTYNRLRNKYNKSKTDNDKDSRDEAKKVYVRMCKSKAAAYDKEETNIFLECKFTDPRKYWQHIKPRTSQCDTNVTPALFAEHFSKLYSSKHILRNVSGDVYDVRNDILDGQFSLYEVECAIKHLKSGKATGPDYIRNEYITYEKQNLKHVLRELFNVIYETGAYPDQWSTGVIVPIYKKGDTNDPANYRGITLTCAMSRLFTFMLDKRINEWAEQSDLFSQAQFAYKTGYSTTDAVFVLNAVLSSSGGCCGFIDF